MRYLFKFCTADIASCIHTRNHFQTLAKDKSRLGIPLSFAEETLVRVVVNVSYFNASLFVSMYPLLHR